MNARADKNSGEWFLAILAVSADLAGIIIFLNIQASLQVRVAVAATLCVLALIAAGSTLWGWIILWFSPRGSYYSNALHLRRLLISIFAALLAVGFGVYVLTALQQEHSKHKPNAGHPSPSARSTSTVYVGSIAVVVGHHVADSR